MRNETPVDRMIPFLIQFETNGVNQIFKRKTKEKKKKKKLRRILFLKKFSNRSFNNLNVWLVFHYYR